MNGNLRTLSALELQHAFENRELSPVEVAENLLEHIQQQDRTINAWCLIDRDTTLAAARASEQRYRDGRPLGVLDGVPIAIKDVFLTPMWPTTRGSRTVDTEATLDKSSPAIAALQRHGYVPLGKTTTSEFGWKTVTDSPLHGTTRNPWDPDKTAGGSSGGSAAALAACMAPLALGTDSGGSIRVPAAFCGVVGLKPTFGEVPHWPASPFGQLAHPGPMARTVADVALLLQVISEADPRDSQAAPRRALNYPAALERTDLKGLRIAYSNNLGYVDVRDDIEKATDQAARTFEELGATLIEVDPGFSNPQAAFGHLFYGGIASACHGLDARQRSRMDPALLEVIRKAERLSMLEYLAAEHERRALGERMTRFHERYDLLLTPTLPITAFARDREVPPDWPSTRWPTWTPFTYPFNMTGQPALSIPLGLADDGLPIGLQIVGRRFQDELVLQAGHLFAQLHPFRQQPELAGAGLEARP